MRIHPTTAISVSVPFAVITLFLVSLVIRARRGKVLTGISRMVNEIGVAQTPLAPDGKVFVHGEYWDASSPRHIGPGERVKVTAVHGLKLSVEPIETD